MRHAARPRTRRSTTRRAGRALGAGLVTLALLMGGTPTLAAEDPPPDDAQLEQQLRAAIEESATTDLQPAAVDEETPPDAEPEALGTGGDEVPAAEPDASPADGDAEAPAAEASDAEAPAVEGAAAEEQAGTQEELDADESATGALLDEADSDQLITPFFVPPEDPGPGEAKLIIQAGGDRTGAGPSSTEVAPLEGVTFELYRTGSADNLTGGTSTGQSCTTDASGACGVFVPLSPGTNYFYAVQTGAPTGWIIPTQWAAGTNYRFSTRPGIDSDGTVAERTRFLPQQIPNTAPDPVWASVRPNPTAPPQCGLDMAMVIDLSNSVTESAPLLTQYKDAATSFVDALTGTPSRVALYTFATNAPAGGASNVGMPLTTVATAGSASALTARINGFTETPIYQDGGTNWDRGFHQVAESGEPYDVVLFLTDGAPTFHRGGSGTGSTTNIREVNEAILSANAVKASGAQVILVGIGSQAFEAGASIRIPLVSGPTEGADFFLTGFDDLATTLEAIATADCEGTLSVVKEIEQPDGTVIAGGAGWTFTTATDGVTPGSATTDESSAVNFEVTYPEGVLARPVTVSEIQQEGYQLIQLGGQNAVCTDTSTGDPVAVTNAEDLGFTVDVPAAGIVSCTVRNAEVPPDYDDLTVTKTALPSFDRDYDWDVEKLVQGADRQEVPAGTDATFTYDVTVTPTGPVDSDFEVTGEITVTNPNDDVAFSGVDVTDTIPGATCTVNGGTDLSIAAGGWVTLGYTCSLPGANAETAGVNTASVTWDAAAYPGTSGTATATADFDFAAGDTDVSVTDASVVVTDSAVDLSEYDDGSQVGNIVTVEDGETVFTYDITWPSEPGECVTYDNTASITNPVGPAFAPMVVNQSSTETVTVCAGLDLTIDKNVVLNFDRTYLWDIDKDVDQTSVTVGPDGAATFDYVVTATPLGFTDSAWAMQGAITVTNPNEWLDITADVTDVTDVGGGATCTVAGGEDAVIAAGATVELTYTCTFTSEPSFEGTNTARVTWGEDVPTPSSSAEETIEISAGGWSQQPNNATINVIDDQTDPANPVSLGIATWNSEGTPVEFPYSITLDGEAGTCVDYTNTAWIQQTQQEASQTVTVCRETAPGVTKTADGSFDRTYEWDVGKSVDDTDVTVDEDGRATFGYVVEAVPGGWTDSGWAAAGQITVTNPNDFGPLTVSVTDAVDVGGGVCTVEDGEGVVVPPSASVTLDYECTFATAPDGDGLNAAEVAWTDADGADRTETAQAPLDFELDGETDRIVDVHDQLEDAAPELLGQAEWNDAGTPVTFSYERTHQGVGGVCVEFTNTAWVDVTDGEDPSDSETVEVCAESPLEHEKAAVSADQLPSGEWVVRYQIDVVNDGTYDAVYDLSDTLEFGGGITPLAAAWFPEGNPAGGGTWTDLPGVLTTVLATGAEIAAGDTHTYVVVVTADVAAGVIGTEPGECSGEDGTDGGGFLNAARLVSGDLDETSRDCLEPAAPSVEKTAGGLAENADGTWTVTYDVVVDNPSDTHDLAYDLSDSLGFAEGVAIGSATVTRGGTTYEEWDGVEETAIVAGEALPAGETHSYTVTVVVSLLQVVDDDVRHCGVNGSNAGQGLFNGVTLTSGNDSVDDEACVPIPEPELDLDKTALAATLGAAGTWTVTYQVTVSNDSAVGGTYHLTDTLEYGEGITPLTAQWSLEGTDEAGTWDLTAGMTTVLAQDRPLAGGATHTYLVSVVAEVGEEVIGSDAGHCSEQDDVEGGGFLNAATLTSYGDPVTDRDCLEPHDAPWTLQKTSDPASGTQVRPGATITYTVTATPTGTDAPVDVTVRDDLSEVLEHASVTGDVDASVGTVRWDGEDLVWEIPRLAEAQTLTYRVTVDDDAWDVTLVNVVTGSPDPLCIGSCSTTHDTPPKPRLPVTGADLTGPAAAAVLLTLLGAGLATSRRRREG